jgi:hypothetical protein
VRSWFRRLSRGQRILAIIASVVMVLGLLVVIGVGIVYPRVGEWMLRSKVVPRLEARLGRTIEIGDVDISLGHAVLHRVAIRGRADGDRPLVAVRRVDVDFDVLASFVGDAELEDIVADGVAVGLRRGSDTDNYSDLIQRLGLRGGDPAASAAGGGGGLGSLRPRRVRVKSLTGVLADVATGSQLVIGDGEAELSAERDARVRLAKIAITTSAGPGASIASIAIERPRGGEPTVTVIDGVIEPWRKLALTGISGTIAPNGEPGRYDVDLAGGYGGVANTLWTATGWIDPATGTGAIDATAEEFTLDKLAPVLEGSPVKDYGTTRLDAGLHVDLAPERVGYRADFHLSGLTVGHPMIADDEVKNLALEGSVSGSFTRATRTLVVDHGQFKSAGLPFVVTGSWALPGGALPDGTRRAKHAIDGRLLIPPIDCQKALTAIPKAFAPELQGYKLRGLFRSDIRLAIDWADIPATTLDGSVRIRDCKVHERPEDSVEDFLEPFEHFVEVEKDQWISFDVGPENPDYVPLVDVSPNLVKSLMTTEDGGFYKHKGFIVGEFQSALIKNLEAGDFKWGASSITMQLIKNIALYRKKTLSRKFQELFLTWDIENVLEKDRIMELYVNVIEFGPGLYGIGPASREYFNKHPRDLNLVEAAFFSSILPSPKDRYMQLCDGTLTKWTSGKIERILDKMRERDRVTEEEYQKALATPLLFERPTTETEKQCKERVKKVIKNQRSTNPMKQ